MVVCSLSVTRTVPAPHVLTLHEMPVLSTSTTLPGLVLFARHWQGSCALCHQAQGMLLMGALHGMCSTSVHKASFCMLPCWQAALRTSHCFYCSQLVQHLILLPFPNCLWAAATGLSRHSALSKRRPTAAQA